MKALDEFRDKYDVLGKNFRHRKNWKPTENETAVELSTL